MKQLDPPPALNMAETVKEGPWFDATKKSAPAAQGHPNLSNSQTDSELSRFFDLSLDLLCIASTDGYFRRVNASFSRVLGYSREELQSRPFLEWVHPDDYHSTLREMDKLAEGAPTLQFRNRYREKNGRYRHLEWNAIAVPQEDVVYACARDVTERVELTARLRANEDRERAILDNASAVIYVKDFTGQYQFINRAFREVVQKSATDIIGKTDRDLFPPEITQVFHRHDAMVFGTGEAIRVEEMVPHPDGPHTYASTKVPLPDAAGHVQALAGISTDITEHLKAKRAEDELLMAQVVQQRLYPSQAPALAGFDIAGASFPMSHLCGDYYDFIPCSDPSCLGLAVGDVSGHGLGPALKMVEIRALLRLLLHESDDMVSALQRVNQLLMEDSPESYFITLFLVEIQASTRRVKFLGAGHNAWLVRPHLGQIVELDSAILPLGIAEFGDFALAPAHHLEPGDFLLLFTDGLNEAMDGQGKMFGNQRLLDVVLANPETTAQNLVTRLLAEVRAFVPNQTLRDDATIIVAKAV